jgi:hypothetical protein
MLICPRSLGAMEVRSSTEMGAHASHLGIGDYTAEPIEADRDQSLVNAFLATQFRIVGDQNQSFPE